MARLRNEMLGWQEALGDRSTRLNLLGSLLWAALLIVLAVWGTSFADPVSVVLGTLLLALVVLLLRLRFRGG